MKTKFSENIKALRKRQNLTQEQLAEAMGVTPGAIYKWEHELSTPDIEIIMELASFFHVSVDALVGYQMGASDKERILQELKQIKTEKTYQNCWSRVEGWVLRYPNDFDIVYNSGFLYHLSGIETHCKEQAARAVELLSHACSLIEQNTDPEISETSIRQHIAISYFCMGETEEGLNQLKKYNPCGINDDLIGEELAAICKKTEEAEPFLARALIQNTVRLIRIVTGYVHCFLAKDNFDDTIAMYQWLLAYLEGLKPQNGVSYLDRSRAVLLINLGIFHIEKEESEPEQAKACFRKARQTALAFDAAPDYTNHNMRYCEKLETRTAYDAMGDTAMNAVMSALQDGAEGPDSIRFQLWEEVCHEE